MVYSDTTNKNGVIQVFERKTDQGYASVSGDATKLSEATAIANEKSHEIWHEIFKATGNWQYDDGGYTDLPSATTDLVSGQDKYALPPDALTVQRIEAKDTSGLWYVLDPITKEQLADGIDEYLKDDGTPEQYTLVNGTIQLFPASNYASTDGLKVYFDRDSVDFATSDTTKTPGFASPYHELLPILMAIEWLTVKLPNSPTLALLLQAELKFKKALREFYGLRFKDLKPKITRKYESYK